MQSGPNVQNNCRDAVSQERLLALCAGEQTLTGEGPGISQRLECVSE